MRKRLRKANTSKWKSLASQGQGIQEFFGNKIGNTWLYNPELLKPILGRIKIKNKHIRYNNSIPQSQKGHKYKLPEMRRPDRNPRTHFGTMHYGTMY